MIIVVNGHYKSASTRLFCSLLELFQQEVPDEFRCFSHKRNPDLIRLLKHSHTIPSHHIVSKIHIYDSELIKLLKSRGCIFLFTERNLYDTAISHKFHYENEHSLRLSTARYLFGVGFLKMIETRIYRHYARPLSDFTFSYSDVMCKTASILSLLNHDLDLGYSDAQIATAALSSDFRDRDINLLLGNCDKREWFTRRPTARTPFHDSFLLYMSVFLSGLVSFFLTLSGFDKTLISLRHNLYWSALRD